MKKFLIKSLMMSAALALCLPVISSAKNITVGTGGTYSTLSGAFSNVSTGDTIIMLPGVYYEQTVTPNTTDNVTITAQIYGTVTVDGNNTISAKMPNSFSNAILLQNATNWKIQGLAIFANGGTDCIQQWQASSANIVEDCLIVGNRDTTTSGPAFGNFISYTGAESWTVRHCTIVNGDVAGFSNYKDLTPSDMSIKDNIFANLPVGLRMTSSAAGLDWDGIVNDYNLFYNVATAVQGGTSASTTGPHDLVNVNPLFVAISTDFRLQANSPARGSGSKGSARGARWLAGELGDTTNTLFLYHFDNSSTKADYAKAVNGPINAKVGTRSMNFAVAKFGAGSYPANGIGETRFSIFTNGQWLINPHEGTIDFWAHYTTWVTGGYGALGPSFFLRTGTPSYDRDFRWMIQPSGNLVPYFLSTTGGAGTEVYTIPVDQVTTLAPVGQWNHFAWEWTSLGNYGTFYINGNPITTFSNWSAFSYAISDAQWQEIDTVFSGSGASLGWQVVGLQASAGYGFPGRIDELRVSNIARYGGGGFAPPTTPYVGFTTEVENWMLFDTKESKL